MRYYFLNSHFYKWPYAFVFLFKASRATIVIIFKQSFRGTKLVNGFEKSKHLEKLKLFVCHSSEFKTSEHRSKTLRLEILNPVVDRNRPIKNTSTRLYRLANQCRLPIENVTSGVLR